MLIYCPELLIRARHKSQSQTNPLLDPHYTYNKWYQSHTCFERAMVGTLGQFNVLVLLLMKETT